METELHWCSFSRIPRRSRVLLSRGVVLVIPGLISSRSFAHSDEFVFPNACSESPVHPERLSRLVCGVGILGTHGHALCRKRTHRRHSFILFRFALSFYPFFFNRRNNRTHAHFGQAGVFVQDTQSSHGVDLRNCGQWPTVDSRITFSTLLEFSLAATLIRRSLQGSSSRESRAV